jgi:Raf kinase inhibitor-like YbhB/YbcL family protein
MQKLAMVAALVAALAGWPMLAQEASQDAPAPLAKVVLKAEDKPKFQITSSAFRDGGGIPFRHSDYDEGVSPPLAWTGAPEATRSFVIVMEGPEAIEERPFINWIAYNIPANVQELPEGVLQQAVLPEPQGMMQGVNSVGQPGYVGPAPPIGGGAHRYYIQIFALDSELDLAPNASRGQLLDAMQGHVLAMGEIKGEFQAGGTPGTATGP